MLRIRELISAWRETEDLTLRKFGMTRCLGQFWEEMETSRERRKTPTQAEVKGSEARSGSLRRRQLQMLSACNSVQWSTASMASLAWSATRNLQVAHSTRLARVRISPSPPFIINNLHGEIVLVGNGLFIFATSSLPVP